MQYLTAPLFKYLSGGLAIALLIFIGLWKMEQRHARKADERVRELTELRKADRASYEAAQAEAKRRNIEQVQKIEAQHEEITDRVRTDYQRDLDRLRAQARANQGSAGGPGSPGVPKAPGRVDEKDLPLPAERVLPLAQELELKCNALIDWVSGQMGVQGNADLPKAAR